MKINKKIQVAQKFRKDGTKSERMLWKYILKDNKYHWIKQRIINGYIVDFYCDTLKLIIEVDGETHDITDNIFYDKTRTKVLENEGLKIIRLRNEDIQSGIYDMKDYIEYLISERIKELNI